jgi:hypothetical protein
MNRKVKSNPFPNSSETEEWIRYVLNEIKKYASLSWPGKALLTLLLLSLPIIIYREWIQAPAATSLLSGLFSSNLFYSTLGGLALMCAHVKIFKALRLKERIENLQEVFSGNFQMYELALEKVFQSDPKYRKILCRALEKNARVRTKEEGECTRGNAEGITDEAVKRIVGSVNSQLEWIELNMAGPRGEAKNHWLIMGIGLVVAGVFLTLHLIGPEAIGATGPSNAPFIFALCIIGLMLFWQAKHLRAKKKRKVEATDRLSVKLDQYQLDEPVSFFPALERLVNLARPAFPLILRSRIESMAGLKA